MSGPPDPESLLHSHILAGVAGSLVGLRWAPGATWLERAGNLLAGCGCAVYVTPGIAEWADIHSPRSLAALSFAVGMFGLSIAAAVVQALRDAKLGEALESLIRRGNGGQ